MGKRVLEKMERNLEILVVEDTPEFREVASSAYAKIGAKSSFAENYEQALKKIREGNFDSVISDLFFPENDKQIRGAIANKLMEKLKPIVDSITPRIYQEIQKELEWGVEPYVQEFQRYLDNQTKEAPLGFNIAIYCAENNIPYTLVSQGDRHEGVLGGLRYSIEYSPIVHELLEKNFRDMLVLDYEKRISNLKKAGRKKDENELWKKGLHVRAYQILTSHLYRTGREVDKNQEGVWEEALQETNSEYSRNHRKEYAKILTELIK